MLKTLAADAAAPQNVKRNVNVETNPANKLIARTNEKVFNKSSIFWNYCLCGPWAADADGDGDADAVVDADADAELLMLLLMLMLTLRSSGKHCQLGE